MSAQNTFSIDVQWKPFELFPILEDKSYIYSLYSEDGELIYIGQTCNIFQRISSHYLSKKFHSVKYFIVSNEMVNEIEAEMIIVKQPYLNERIPLNKKYTCLEWFQKSHPPLKGKMVKIKKAVKKLGLRPLNGYYLIEQLNPILSLILEGGV